MKLNELALKSMTDIPEELKRLEIPGRVSFQEGNGELPKLAIQTEWSAAEIYLHGAHVTDFRKNDEPPLLFTSQFSRFEAGQAIRGGVPIILPWFGAREGEPMHGFARTSNWVLHETAAFPDGGVSLRFALPATPESAMWPRFTANYIVTVTDSLSLKLVITNASPSDELTFENCLHTYFHVGDVSEISIHGLKAVHYLDKVDGFAPKTESSDSIRVKSEVDRIYLDTANDTEIRDPKLRRTIHIRKSGSSSTVVWNPWIKKSQQMPDFGSDEYLRMVCVESGNVSSNRIVLPPGLSSSLSVEISSEALG